MCVRFWCALAVCQLTGAPAAYSQRRATVLEALSARENEFDHVRIKFDWLQCRAWLNDDPFDPETWHLDPKSSVLYRCSIWIVRPHLRLAFSSHLPEQRDTVRTWIDGKRTSRSRDPDGSWSVKVDENRWAIHGPVPYLTPFEMQVCDVQHSLLTMVQAGGLEVQRDADDELVLAGHRTSQPRDPDWKVRATLDPRRGFLPLELRADIDFENRKHIRWTVRTLDSVALNSIHIIGEAIFALDSSSDRKRWQIYHYKLTEVVRDESLSKQKLAIDIPEKNAKFIDDTTGYIRWTNAAGKITYEKQLTTEEMEDRARALETVRRQEVVRYEQLAKRRAAFRTILSGGAAVALGAAGLWLWQRRKRRFA